MRISLKMVVVLMLFITTALEAVNAQNYYKYGDINSNLNKRAIVEIAKHEIRRLVIRNKVSKSWKIAKVSDVKKIAKASSDDWMVSFYNKKIQNSKRQYLYIFLDTRGNVVGANYKGR